MEVGDGPEEPTAEDQIRADEAIRILGEYVSRNHQDDTSQVLRAFVDHLPPGGQRNVVTDILAHADDPPRLRALRNLLVDAVLKPMKTGGGRSSSRSTPVSAPPDSEALTDIGELGEALEPSTRGPQGTLKLTCLRRDGFRCPVSGLYHVSSAAAGHVQVPEGGATAESVCCHILPSSLRNFERSRTREVNNKATIWWALYRYFPSLHGTIGADSVNQPQNAITLSPQVDQFFGMFLIALDQVDGEADRYTVTPLGTAVTTTPPSFPVGQTISLASNDPQVPPPSPRFLDVHARTARILEVSGIGEKIQRNVDLPTSAPAAARGQPRSGRNDESL